jgi:hypothetical protein
MTSTSFRNDRTTTVLNMPSSGADTALSHSPGMYSHSAAEYLQCMRVRASAGGVAEHSHSRRHEHTWQPPASYTYMVWRRSQELKPTLHTHERLHGMRKKGRWAGMSSSHSRSSVCGTNAFDHKRHSAEDRHLRVKLFDRRQKLKRKRHERREVGGESVCTESKVVDRETER